MLLLWIVAFASAVWASVDVVPLLVSYYSAMQQSGGSVELVLNRLDLSEFVLSALAPIQKGITLKELPRGLTGHLTVDGERIPLGAVFVPNGIYSKCGRPVGRLRNVVLYSSIYVSHLRNIDSECRATEGIKSPYWLIFDLRPTPWTLFDNKESDTMIPVELSSYYEFNVNFRGLLGALCSAFDPHVSAGRMLQALYGHDDPPTYFRPRDARPALEAPPYQFDAQCRVPHLLTLAHTGRKRKNVLMINGYSRDDVVLRNVPKYLKCSFLWKVVLMWSNMERKPSKELFALAKRSEDRFQIVEMSNNTLNNRYAYMSSHDESYIHTDDDILVPCDALHEFLNTHRTHPAQITGAHRRSHMSQRSGGLKYSMRCSPYSMVLTKLMVLSSDHHYVYNCLAPPGVTAVVDQLRNCEDLAMNFVVSAVTNLAPVYHHFSESVKIIDSGNDGRGISSGKKHGPTRSHCLTEFMHIFRRNPLIYSSVASIDIPRSKKDGDLFAKDKCTNGLRDFIDTLIE